MTDKTGWISVDDLVAEWEQDPEMADELAQARIRRAAFKAARAGVED